MSSELEIIILQPSGRLLGSFVQSETRIVLGSGPSSTVVIADAALLPEHAVIHFTGRSCIIESMPGAPAFFVNGEAKESHLVQAQDTMTLGAHTIRMVVHRLAAASSPPVVAAPVQLSKPAAAVAPMRKVALVPPPVDAPAAEAQSTRDDTEKTVIQTRPELSRTQPSSVNHATAKQAPVKKAAIKAAPAKPAPVTSGALALKLEPLPPPSDVEPPDEDDEEDDYAPFPILEALHAPDVLSGPLLAQAICSHDNFVTKVVHLPPGKATKLGALTFRHTQSGTIVVSGAGLSVRAEQRGQTIALDSLRKPGAGGSDLHVPAGVQLLIEREGSSNDSVVIQHVVRASAGPSIKRRFKIEREVQWAIMAALALHFLAVLVFGLSSKPDGVVDTAEGRYAEVKLKDLELEPPPPPTPEVQPTPETPPPEAKAVPQKRAPKTQQARAPSTPQAPAAPQKSAAAANLLSALGGGLSAPSASNALAAASNLDAVATPKGAGFKVSGVIGKMPGNELKLGAAGSDIGRVDTKSANELTKGGTLGKVTGTAGSGKVRGVVSGPPPRSVEVQGQLDRSEIQKVVNDHLHEVQGCYERQLVKDPALAGKIVSEWVITPAGTVGAVKIKSSSVRNNEVANCIQAALKRWKFPQPKGGSVTVTYPFVFSTIGM